MLFKLSLKNIKNSFRDYAIYFYTLVIGVSVFYAFNAINDQTAMLELTGDLGRTAALLNRALSGMSIFIAVVLGLLIVYASRFLMKRRSKEFAVYLMLGMGRRNVSAILLLETILTGAVSLVTGLLIGMGLSQIMGIFVVRLFNRNMLFYSFCISGAAVLKTIVYFVLMYLVVMLLSGHAVSRMKLIDLINSGRKTENVKLKNPVLCVIVFIAACVLLGISYYTVAWQGLTISTSVLPPCIAAGAAATVMIFWSVSGMMLRIVGSMKKTYYKGLTCFTFRQISSKINTVVLSMSVICLMLFFTICALCSAFALRSSMNKAISNCLADFQIRHMEIVISSDEVPHFDDIVERYAGYGYDLPSRFGEYTHFHTYYDPAIDLGEISKLSASEIYFGRHDCMDIVSLSDYNALMELYGREKVDLDNDSFLLMCNTKDNRAIFDKWLKSRPTITVFGHTLTAKDTKPGDGFIEITGANTNTGLLIIPDEAADESCASDDLFIGNYPAASDGERAELETLCLDEHIDIENRMADDQDEGRLNTGYYSQLQTRKAYEESTVGTTAMATIVFLYLGIVFLLASGVILALRELSDSVDSIPRYDILRKIGAEEKEIEKSLFIQSAVLFTLPLLLASVHSVFGIKMASSFIALLGGSSITVPVIYTGAAVLLIYGGYFALTFNTGKRIIKPERNFHEEMTGREVIKIAVSFAAIILLLAGLIFITGRGNTNPYSTGSPWIDSDLEGLVTKRTETSIRDDFALAANKDDLLKLEIAEDASSAGTMTDLDRQASEDIKKLFQEGLPQSHDAELICNLYQLMTDWESRDAIGAAPLKEKVDVVENITSIDELTKYLAETPEEDRLKKLWSSGATTDLDNSDQQILYVSTCGLSLGDSAEYRELSASGKKEKKAYRAFAEKMLVKLGYSKEEAGQKIDNHYRFESMIAPAVPTADEQKRSNYISKSNNHYTRSELMEAQGKLPVLAELENAQGYPAADNYKVVCPDFLKKMNELYTEENLPLIRDYIITGSLLAEAESLDSECREWSDEFLCAISGTDASEDDQIANAAGMLSWATAKFYTETYLKEEDKERVTDLVNEILEEYRGIIEEADFLSDASRQGALAKLMTIDKRILYPDDWSKYSYDGLDIKSKAEGGTYREAIRRIDEYNQKKLVEKFGQPVDKTEWSAVPQNANCYYDSQTNSIYIMGAFVHDPLYNSGMSDEELYARLGVVIGHEISHAFDSTGAQFDKDGNMKNWWTDEDKEAFREKNKKMASFYNTIHPWEGQYLKGGIMTGEACADMAGMKCVLRLASKKQGFDYDRFFRSYANVWLTKDSLQAARARVDDKHPMPYLRINVTLQQFDEFLDCYGIKEGDGMYLAPEDRVCIW